jgi:hypothetical protein
VLSTIAAARTHAEMLNGVAAQTATTHGYELAFRVGALMALAGAVSAAALLRPTASAQGKRAHKASGTAAQAA